MTGSHMPSWWACVPPEMIWAHGRKWENLITGQTKNTTQSEKERKDHCTDLWVGSLLQEDTSLLCCLQSVGTHPLRMGSWSWSVPASVRTSQQAAGRLTLLPVNLSSIITAWPLVSPPNPLPHASMHPKATQSLGHMLACNYSLEEDKACLGLCYWAGYHYPATKVSVSWEPEVRVPCEWWIAIPLAAGALQILNIYEPSSRQRCFPIAATLPSMWSGRVEKVHGFILCTPK